MARRGVIRDFLQDVLDDGDGVEERPLVELAGRLQGDGDDGQPDSGGQAVPAEPPVATTPPPADPPVAATPPPADPPPVAVAPAPPEPPVEVQPPVEVEAEAQAEAAAALDPEPEAVTAPPADPVAPAVDPQPPAETAPAPTPASSIKARPKPEPKESTVATGAEGLEAATSNLDGDDLLDLEDGDLDGDGKAQPLDGDTDNDGIANKGDDDNDGDSFLDITEPAAAATAVGAAITDPNAVLTEVDLDHLIPTDDLRIEQAARQATVADGIAVAQSDFDGDGIVDHLDRDLDNDGILNANDDDDDNDGIVDRLDIDTDSDGFADATERAAARSNLGFTPGDDDDVIILGKTDAADTIASVEQGAAAVFEGAKQFVSTVTGDFFSGEDEIDERQRIAPAVDVAVPDGVDDVDDDSPSPALVAPAVEVVIPDDPDDNVIILHRDGDPTGPAVTQATQREQKVREATRSEGDFVAKSDLDRDGTVDLNDRDLDNDGFDNREDVDDDNDGILDSKDIDSDGDGFTDESEPGAFLEFSKVAAPSNFEVEVRNRDAETDTDVQQDQFEDAARDLFESASESVGEAFDAFTGGLFGGDD